MVQEVVVGLTTNSLISFGLPSVIVQLVVPRLFKLFQRHPRGARLLTYLAGFLSAVGTFTFGIKPIFARFMWNWLPQVRLQSGDLLYQYLRSHVHAKEYPTVPNSLNVTADATNTSSASNVDNELDWNEVCNPEKDTQCGQESDITYENPSSRLFFHKGTLFMLETPFDVNHSQSLKLRALAVSHKPIKSLLTEAWTKYRRQAIQTTTAVYKPSDRAYEMEWKLSKHKPIRHLSTVDIDNSQKRRLIDDVTKYISPRTKAWYYKRGIPCRRGYLFHGPPGTGKSSLAAAVAGHFRTRLYTLSLNDRGLSDGSLLTLLNKMKKGSVLLIEDIDSSGIRRESYEDVHSSRSRSNVSLSGLLNALDGASAPEGHILIMSTNTPDALDPAMRRAGRVDCEVEFKNASKTCAFNIFLRMMGDDDDDDDTSKIAELESKASDFVAELPEYTFSPAQIQGFLLDHRFDIQGAIANASRWAQEAMDRRDEVKEAAERAEKAVDACVAQEQQHVEAAEHTKELEDQACGKRESAAATTLEELERQAKEMTLKAEKLRAEAEIAKYETRDVKPAVEQKNALMTPADSDEEQS